MLKTEFNRQYQLILTMIDCSMDILSCQLSRPGDYGIGARITEIAYCLAQDEEAWEELTDAVNLFHSAFDLLESVGRESHRTYNPEEPYTPSPVICDLMNPKTHVDW